MLSTASMARSSAASAGSDGGSSLERNPVGKIVELTKLQHNVNEQKINPWICMRAHIRTRGLCTADVSTSRERYRMLIRRLHNDAHRQPVRVAQ